jgi:mannan endo-1,4-beta-mannosidase
MKHQRKRQKKPFRFVILMAVVIVLAAGAVAAVRHYRSDNSATGPLPTHLPHAPESYIGVYSPQAPSSWAGIAAFKTATGVTPDVAMYYSGWYEGFQVSFATTAARQGAVPLVQIDPEHINLAKIADGTYDGFLTKYASEVRTYRHPVIISFGHEMNGNWYDWGYQHTPPKVFVAAWRHIVTVFRQQGADNVTWLWTVNIIDRRGGIPDPAPWWPGSSYVTWVGIDGYYLRPSWTFASLFGPTIKAVRTLTLDPVLLAETGATSADGQPSKIADLFAGVHGYGLLGFVWFDGRGTRDWRLSPTSFAALRLGAQTLNRPAP